MPYFEGVIDKKKNIARVAKSCPESWSVVKVLRYFVLLKYVIIATSVTTLIFITITIYVFELSKFYFFSFGQFEFLSLVTILSLFVLSFVTICCFFFSFITVWVLEFCHNLVFFLVVTVWFCLVLSIVEFLAALSSSRSLVVRPSVRLYTLTVVTVVIQGVFFYWSYLKS